MSIKRILAIGLILILPALVGLTYGEISVELSYLLTDLFGIHFNSYPLQFVVIALAAMLCALLVFRAGAKRQMLVLVVLIFLSAAILYTQYRFYEMHDHPDYGDIQNIPECMKETNYNSFWEYLNEGCHLTLSEFTLSLSYKSVAWVGFFFLTDWMLRRKRSLKNKHHSSRLIDENEW